VAWLTVVGENKEEKAEKGGQTDSSARRW